MGKAKLAEGQRPLQLTRRIKVFNQEEQEIFQPASTPLYGSPERECLSETCGRKSMGLCDIGEVAMKETNTIRVKICPYCGKPYYEPPALSRIDNKTLICPDCGTREALASIDVDREEQEEILAIIHRQRRNL